MVALQVQGFCWIFAIFPAPIIPQIGLYGLKYKAFSIIQCTLSKSEFETVLSGMECVKRPVEDAVLRNLRLENLRGAIAELDMQGQNLLSLRYSDALTMEEISQIYGISRMAVSKRLKKLHEKLGSSVS